MDISETEREKIQKGLKLLEGILPDEYKPDFFFIKSGTILEQEEYQRKVEEIIKGNARCIISFYLSIYECPRDEGLKRGDVRHPVTRVYEMENKGVIFYQTFEGITDSQSVYSASVKLLGFNRKGKAYRDIRNGLEQIASEGDK